MAGVVCFEPKLHIAMDKLSEKGRVVALVNCCIQEGKYNNGMKLWQHPIQGGSSLENFKVNQRVSKGSRL